MSLSTLLSFFVVVVVFCLYVVFIAPFAPSPLRYCCLITSAEEAQNLGLSLVASIWASSPHFLCYFVTFTYIVVGKIIIKKIET